MAGIKNIFICLVMVVLCQELPAQSLPVGMPVLEDQFRREQLLGSRDSAVSFTIRPLSSRAFTAPEDILAGENDSDNEFTLLPFSWIQQINTSHPYGWNDGAMISAKGYQTSLSGGLAAKYGPVSLQFKPEVTFASNPAYEGYPADGYPLVWRTYYEFYNNIDLPERIGDGGFRNFSTGQSNLKFNYKGFSIGASTENLWWGPGERNSLLMSNTAPGFLHLTLNTNKPYYTRIGSFEGQFIWGRLEGTTNQPTQIKDYMYANSTLYAPKTDDWRHLSGITVTYQPKWLHGLFVGLARTSQVYNNDVGSIGDVLPFFSKFNRMPDETEPVGSPDRYTSVFFRWLMQSANAEFYFEYGHNDQSKTLGNFIKNPDAGRAYIFGTKKIFNLARSGEHIVGSLELTQLGQSQEDELLHDVNSWYVDPNVRHGYTHMGQLLGAGIGPGGSMQSLDVSWFKGMKTLGIQVERVVHNQDYYFYTYSRSQDFRRHWVDMGYAAVGSWDFNGLLLNARFAAIKSLNYQWFLLQEPGEPYWIKGRDKLNFHARLGISYFF